jgi:hypothetical protein
MITMDFVSGLGGKGELCNMGHCRLLNKKYSISTSEKDRFNGQTR